MTFMNAVKETLNEDFNSSVTENGMIGYRTSGKNLLDLNFAVSSLRNASDKQIVDKWNGAYYEDKGLAMRWLFYCRDREQGLGERRTFRVILKDIAKNEPEVAKKLIGLVAEYGRFDDLWMLLDNKDVFDDVIGLINNQLKEDMINMKANKPVSLISKWLPSENASSKETKRYAKIIREALGLTSKQYRKILSKLRGYIDVVEHKMSAKQWENINYEAVPSRANLIYNDAFLRNDEQRRRDYLGKLEKGEAKINASVLFPHDIVHKYNSSSYGISMKKYDAAIEALWKALPDTVNGCGNTIVVADGSGSMTTRVGNTNVMALEVANALAIYFAEHSSGDFKDKYITFSERPQLVDFSKANSLRDKIQIALRHNEVANTNIEAVFDLILTTAINGHMSQDELPKNILIISDMEFDGAVTTNAARSRWDARRPDQRLFKVIEKRYNDAGYQIPRIVFWNLCSRTNTIPVKENDLGVALVSGFSPNIAKMVMSGKTDPFECLVEALMNKRYDAVSEALK